MSTTPGSQIKLLNSSLKNNSQKHLKENLKQAQANQVKFDYDNLQEIFANHIDQFIQSSDLESDILPDFYLENNATQYADHLNSDLTLIDNTPEINLSLDRYMYLQKKFLNLLARAILNQPKTN